MIIQRYLKYYCNTTLSWGEDGTGDHISMRKALVHIYEMQLEEYDLPRIRIRVRCSKGTYIRSLAHEIGQALESGAHLTSLCRTRSGGFRVENAHSLDDFLKKLQELETK